MEEIFVIIQCGYEGIDKLVYATLNSTDAINKINELKQNILAAREHRKQVIAELGGDLNDSVNTDTDWDKLLYDNKITRQEYEDACCNDPDQYCIQKWDGETFKCVCQESNCPPSEMWLM